MQLPAGESPKESGCFRGPSYVGSWQLVVVNQGMGFLRRLVTQPKSKNKHASFHYRGFRQFFSLEFLKKLWLLKIGWKFIPLWLPRDIPGSRSPGIRCIFRRNAERLLEPPESTKSQGLLLIISSGGKCRATSK